MGRKLITDALQEASKKYGYAFYHASEDTFIQVADQLPCVTLNKIKLKSERTGKAGIAKYKVRLTLSDSLYNAQTGEPSELSDRMEADFISILNVAGQHDKIKSISAIEYLADEKNLTPDQDVNFIADFTIELPYGYN